MMSSQLSVLLYQQGHTRIHYSGGSSLELGVLRARAAVTTPDLSLAPPSLVCIT